MGDYSGSLHDARTAIDLGEVVGDAWPISHANWVLAELASYIDVDMWRPLSDVSIAALTASGDRFALGYARLWQAVPLLIRAYQPEGIAALVAATDAVNAVANPTLNASYKIWQGWAALQAGELRRTDQLATEVMTGPGFRLATQRLFGELLLAAAACYRGLHHPVLDEFSEPGRIGAPPRRDADRGHVPVLGVVLPALRRSRDRARPRPRIHRPARRVIHVGRVCRAPRGRVGRRSQSAMPTTGGHMRKPPRN